MFYELVFDMERIDDAIKQGTNTIYAEESNLDEIEYPSIKRGFFCYIINNGERIENWPNVEFYYSSKASNLENEYLLNSWDWPIIHKKVQEEFEKNEIAEIQYLPVKLIDEVTKKVNENYVVMNILSFIEAIDLKKSKYTYDKKYDTYTFLPHATYLDKSVCQHYDIFRATKSFPSVYISQKVKDIIEGEQWIGFYFNKQQTN